MKIMVTWSSTNLGHLQLGVRVGVISLLVMTCDVVDVCVALNVVQVYFVKVKYMK